MLLIVQDSATTALAQLAAGLADQRPALQAAGDAIAQLALRSFRDEAVRAAPWAPLAPRTVAAKLAAGAMTGTLMRHGLLSRSFRVTEVLADAVAIGSDRPYARWHQVGTARLPARPMLPINAAGQLTPLAARNMLTAVKAVLGLG